jgi:hypothetical protein
LADWLGNAGSPSKVSTPIRADSAGARRVDAHSGTHDELHLAALTDYTGRACDLVCCCCGLGV